MTTAITVEAGGRSHLLNRGRLATAILLTYDHRGDVRTVVDILERDCSIDRIEAMRYALVAETCIREGIEP